MRNDHWKRIDERYAEFPRARGEGASEQEIAAAEEALGVSFDDDYKEFLRRYGSGFVGPDPIYGVRPFPARPKGWSVVEQTRRYRQEQWPGVAEWYVISKDGRGNPIGMDPEGKVWMSDHDVGDVPMVAESFEGFIDHLLKLGDAE